MHAAPLASRFVDIHEFRDHEAVNRALSNMTGERVAIGARDELRVPCQWDAFALGPLDAQGAIDDVCGSELLRDKRWGRDGLALELCHVKDDRKARWLAGPHDRTNQTQRNEGAGRQRPRKRSRGL
jgi:hypothetical protein